MLGQEPHMVYLRLWVWGGRLRRAALGQEALLHQRLCGLGRVAQAGIICGHTAPCQNSVPQLCCHPADSGTGENPSTTAPYFLESFTHPKEQRHNTTRSALGLHMLAEAQGKSTGRYETGRYFACVCTCQIEHPQDAGQKQGSKRLVLTWRQCLWLRGIARALWAGRAAQWRTPLGLAAAHRSPL